MRTTKYFLVKPEIAERAGVIESRYHTVDGLIVLNEQDMGRVRLQPEEYLTGVVERVIDETEAANLIEEAGRKMGRLTEEIATEQAEVADEQVDATVEHGEVINDNNEAVEGLNNE